MKKEIPYKIYLSENELPKYWYNVRADMETDHAPILNPKTLQPATVADLEPIFCTELAKLYEHRLKDCRAALEYARRSEKYQDGEAREALEKRIARLKHKIEK